MKTKEGILRLLVCVVGWVCLNDHQPIHIHEYAAVGASILWLTYAAKLSPSEISGLVAKGSFRSVGGFNAYFMYININV